MPQELEVWYVLPAIRRELTKILVNEHHLSQKDAASAIGITEPAVSHYLKSKRGKDIKFDDKNHAFIKISADKLVNHKSCTIKEIQKICNHFRKTGCLCKLHKQANEALPGNCEVCMQ